MSWEESS